MDGEQVLVDEGGSKFMWDGEEYESAQDAEAKRLYKYLVDAELTHFDLLMLNYERLSNSTGWVG